MIYFIYNLFFNLKITYVMYKGLKKIIAITKYVGEMVKVFFFFFNYGLEFEY